MKQHYVGPQKHVDFCVSYQALVIAACAGMILQKESETDEGLFEDVGTLPKGQTHLIADEGSYRLYNPSKTCSCATQVAFLAEEVCPVPPPECPPEPEPECPVEPEPDCPPPLLGFSCPPPVAHNHMHGHTHPHGHSKHKVLVKMEECDTLDCEGKPAERTYDVCAHKALASLNADVNNMAGKLVDIQQANAEAAEKMLALQEKAVEQNNQLLELLAKQVELQDATLAAVSA